MRNLLANQGFAVEIQEFRLSIVVIMTRILLNESLLFCKNETREKDGCYEYGKGDKRKDLLRINVNTKYRRRCAVKGFHNFTAQNGCAKSQNTAYTVVYSRCLHEIFSIYTAIRYIDHIAARACVTYVQKSGIYYDQKP